MQYAPIVAQCDYAARTVAHLHRHTQISTTHDVRPRACVQITAYIERDQEGEAKVIVVVVQRCLRSTCGNVGGLRSTRIVCGRESGS